MNKQDKYYNLAAFTRATELMKVNPKLEGTEAAKIAFTQLDNEDKQLILKGTA